MGRDSVLCLLLFFASIHSSFSACSDQYLPSLPDYDQFGPWKVGVQAVDGITSRNLTLWVFYPAEMGSENGAPPTSFQMSWILPPNDAEKVPENFTEQDTTRSYWDLPIDSVYGPFPPLIYMHGFSSWLTASHHQVEHWVSRGFVLFAVNYPGVWIKDILEETQPRLYPPPYPKSDQVGDTVLLINEIQTLSDPRLAFLKGRINSWDQRAGIVGHSAGAMAAGQMGDYAQVIVPMAGYGVDPGSRVVSAMILGANNDTVVGVNPQKEGYATTQTKIKRLGVVQDLGHEFCSDLCWWNADYGGICGVGEMFGIWEAFLPSFQHLASDGCQFVDPLFLNYTEGWEFVNYLSSAAFEETLMCDSQANSRVEAWVNSYEYTQEYKSNVASVSSKKVMTLF